MTVINQGSNQGLAQTTTSTSTTTGVVLGVGPSGPTWINYPINKPIPIKEEVEKEAFKRFNAARLNGTRLKLVLKLHKEGTITDDEAIEFIKSDKYLAEQGK